MIHVEDGLVTYSRPFFLISKSYSSLFAETCVYEGVVKLRSFLGVWLLH